MPSDHAYKMALPQDAGIQRQSQRLILLLGVVPVPIEEGARFGNPLTWAKTDM